MVTNKDVEEDAPGMFGASPTGGGKGGAVGIEVGGVPVLRYLQLVVRVCGGVGLLSAPGYLEPYLQRSQFHKA